MQRAIRLEAVYPHPPKRVWYALTNRQALATWLMDNNFEPCLGSQFQFWERSLPGLDIAIDCQVIALEAPKRLVYTWRPSWMRQHSIVTWTLEAFETGTVLKLCHSGLETHSDSSHPFVNPLHFWQEQFRQQPSATLLQGDTSDRNATTLPSPNNLFLETAVVSFDVRAWSEKLEKKLRQILDC
jgi:uncharacterized protein YndB with AHSA1/START domain